MELSRKSSNVSMNKISNIKCWQLGHNCRITGEVIVIKQCNFVKLNILFKCLSITFTNMHVNAVLNITKQNLFKKILEKFNSK